MGLKSGGAANSDHITKKNWYNFIRSHNHHRPIISKIQCFICGKNTFFVEGGFQYLDVGKLNNFYSYQYSDKFLSINQKSLFFVS